MPLEPLHIPADFWEREPVNAALIAQDFTALFRLARRYAGASQTRIAAACDLSQSMVSQIQTGKHQPAAHNVRRRIADGFHMPNHARTLLDLSALTPEPTLAPDAAPPNSTTPHEPPRTLLAHLIRERDLTYDEAAARVGLSTRHLSRLARQERPLRHPNNLRASTRRALQAVFGYPIDDLLRPWHEQPDPTPAADPKWSTTDTEEPSPGPLVTNTAPDTPDDPTTETFGQALHTLRTVAGLSLDALAQRARYNKAAINFAETGQRTPSRELAAALDRALNANGHLIELAPQRSQASTDRPHFQRPSTPGRIVEIEVHPEPGAVRTQSTVELEQAAIRSSPRDQDDQSGEAISDDDPADLPPTDAFGEALQALRTTAGLSLAALANRIHFSKPAVGHAELGINTPSRDLAAALDHALNAKGHLIELAALRRSQDKINRLVTRPPQDQMTNRRTSARRGATPVSYGAPTTTAETDWAGMLRRTVLMAPAALAALHIVKGNREPSEHMLDPELVQGLLGVAGQYRRAYHAVSASRLLPAALGHLDLVLSLRPASRLERERVPLVTAAGEMAVLAGVLLGHDAASHDESLSYFDIAWTAARAVEDVELQTVTLAARSFALAYRDGNHQAGLECADLARRVAAAGACPQTRGWVAAVASEHSAAIGDLAGSQRRLDESRSALTSSDFGDIPWRGIGGYNADKLRAYEGTDMLRLRRYRDAEPILSDALNGLDPSMSRHRATALLDRAEARYGLGDIDAACSDATQALALVAHVQHTSHLDRIDNLTARGIAAGAQSAIMLNREAQLTRVDNGLPLKKDRT